MELNFLTSLLFSTGFCSRRKLSLYILDILTTCSNFDGGFIHPLLFLFIGYFVRFMKNEIKYDYL